MKKSLLTAFLLTIVITVLASCSGEKAEDSILTLAQGRMDSIYKGTASEEYLELSGRTLDDVTKDYEANIKREAVYFSSYVGIIESQNESLYDALPDETKTKLETMYKDIYSSAVYEVKDPEKEDDGSYSVEITASPIKAIEDSFNIIQTGEYEPYKEFVSKYNTVPGSADTFSQDLANLMIDLVKSQLATTSQENKTFPVKVTENEEGEYLINTEDWTPIDKFIIVYP